MGVLNLVKGNLERIKDINIEITVELGTTRMRIEDILNIGKGSIIELDELTGTPVKIYVGTKLYGTGEIVAIDENYGVKIIEIFR